MRRNSFPRTSELKENTRRVQEGIGMGGSSSLRLLPRFIGPKTDSLSLSTKLINSLRAWPDKLLINWLHPPPFLSAAAGQSPSSIHLRPSTPFRSIPNQGPLVGPRSFCSQGDLVILVPVYPLCSFLQVSPLLGVGVGWSEQASELPLHPSALPPFAPTEGGGVPRGR